MKKLKLGESERDVLLFIARHPNCTVREVSAAFSEERGWGRTTVLKTMDRLLDKELLTRKEMEGVFRYSSVSSEPEIQEALIAQLFAGTLGGSIKPLVAFLDGQANVTEPELEQLRELVRKLEEKKR